MKGRIIYIILVLAAVGLAYGLYTFYKPAVDITQKSASESTSANDLIALFTQNNTEADAQYLSKVIAVSGKITALEKSDNNPTILTFDLGSNYIITMQMAEAFAVNNKIGDEVLVKGQYNGYLPPDEMFDMPGNIQISQCTIEK